MKKISNEKNSTALKNDRMQFEFQISETTCRKPLGPYSKVEDKNYFGKFEMKASSLSTTVSRYSLACLLQGKWECECYCHCITKKERNFFSSGGLTDQKVNKILIWWFDRVWWWVLKTKGMPLFFIPAIFCLGRIRKDSKPAYWRFQKKFFVSATSKKWDFYTLKVLVNYLGRLNQWLTHQFSNWGLCTSEMFVSLVIKINGPIPLH